MIDTFFVPVESKNKISISLSSCMIEMVSKETTAVIVHILYFFNS